MNEFSISRRWQLLQQLLRRDLGVRYRHSLLGLVWMFATPLLMLLVYSFVFGVVFKAKWGVDPGGQTIPFPVLLFSGLILHAMLAEILHRSVTLIRDHQSYVKKVVFPLELLPMMISLSAASLCAIQFLLLVAATLIAGVEPSMSWLCVPLILLPLWLMAFGLACLLSALSVYLPDIQHVIGLLVMLLLFLSPVFYPLEMLPPQWQSVIQLNPLTAILEAFRGALFYRQWPELTLLIGLHIAGLATAFTGLKLFRLLRHGFGEVI